MVWWKLPIGGGKTQDGSGRAGAARDGSSEHLNRILSESCTFRAPATLVERNGLEICRVRFAGLSARELVLDLASGRRARQLHPPAACSVLFSHRNRSLTFVARVLRLDAADTPEQPRQITLSLPQSLAGADLRSAPRVKNASASGLQLEARTAKGDCLSPRLLDLSATGALLEVPPDMTELPVGSELQLSMRFGEQTAQLTGCVRRREGPRVGVFFPEALTGGEPSPPAALAALVASLESLRGQNPRGDLVGEGRGANDRLPVLNLPDL